MNFGFKKGDFLKSILLIGTTIWIIVMLSLLIPETIEPNHLVENVPKMKDCQVMAFDERFIHGTVHRKTICTWETIINGETVLIFKEISGDIHGIK